MASEKLGCMGCLKELLVIGLIVLAIAGVCIAGYMSNDVDVDDVRSAGE